MPAQTRHAFFDRNTVVTVSREHFDRLMDFHAHEPSPSLAGRRIRFLTLWVEFDRGTAVQLLNVEPIWVTFDKDGRRDEAEAARIRRATVQLLDAVSSSTGPSTIVPAAARFQLAGQRWKPTAEELDAVLCAHGLRDALGPPPEPATRSSFVSRAVDPLGAEQDRGHLWLVAEDGSRYRPLTSPARLNASLTKRWSRWHPDSVVEGDDCGSTWDEMDRAVRDVAGLTIDKIYDELTSQGLITGEIITLSMFPTTGESHLAYGFRGAYVPSELTADRRGSNAPPI